MKLPAWLHPALLVLRRMVARLQRWPRPPAGTASIPRLPRGLKQPDRTSCGSSVLVAMQILEGDVPDDFAAAALAMRRRTNGMYDVAGRLQLPWPAGLGTRPAALIRQLGGDWRNHVVDPWRPAAAYDALVGFVRSGQPIPLFIGEGSWMQHIVLVVGATDDHLDIYDPARGDVLRRTRRDFETARLHVAGWDQPWLVILPSSA
ncbi:MAG: hypothetical protein EOO74_03010 [Myxococcales bacterium]|nr:MAG: hypothetical protein EOO74_03010 [Myxococcales bacterium]